MKISHPQTSKNTVQRGQNSKTTRKFTMADIPLLTEKIFSEFDRDKNSRFTKDEFGLVIRTLINLVGGDMPHLDDMQDIFNLLDVNGDETIDRKEFESLMKAFFKLLNEKHIEVQVEKESDLIL